MIRQDQLYLALTRPALTWGVPFEALMLNVMLCFSAGIFLQAPTFWRSPFMFWAAAIPIHLAVRELTGWDYHWFRTLRLEALTVNATTFEALPQVAPKNPREVASSV